MKYLIIGFIVAFVLTSLFGIVSLLIALAAGIVYYIVKKRSVSVTKDRTYYIDKM